VRVGNVSTLALRVRETNSRVNFMQRDMREVGAERSDATTARLIAVATVCDVQLPRFLLESISRAHFYHSEV